MPATSSLLLVDTPAQPSPVDSSSAPAELVERLRAGGLQVTGVRVAMLAAMARISAPVTLRHLQEQFAPNPVAFASLYRCMLRFEEIALVRRSIAFDGTLSWELNPGVPQAFSVACRDTGEIAALDADSTLALRALLEKVERRLRESGYTQLQLTIAFHGLTHPARFRHTAAGSRQRVA